MIDAYFTSHVLAGALVCGLVAYTLGRPLLKLQEAPDFIERLHRHRKRLVLLYILGIAVQPAFVAVSSREPLDIGVALPPSLLAIVVVGLAISVGDFPNRKLLLKEEIGLFAHLDFAVRLRFALLGFWLLVVLLPFGLQGAGANDLWIGAGLLPLLLLWARGYNRALIWMLRARSIESSQLSAHFDEIAARSERPETQVFCFGPEGTSFCNAFAMPSVTAPRVVFSRALLKNLTVEEAGAIYAHELGHIEHYDAARLSRLSWFLYPLLVAAALGQPLARIAMPSDLASGFPLVWLVGLFVLAIARMRRSREHETEADLRGLELCANPGALSSGLIKLHVVNGMPRRWRAELERASTHPSLARRLQAIREAAGIEADETEAHETEICSLRLRACGRATDAAILDADGVHWLCGLPDELQAEDDEEAWREAAKETVRLPWDELVEAQVESTLKGSVLRLQARTGVIRKLRLSPDDVAELQALLDRFDRKLAPLAAASQKQREGRVALALLFASLCSLPPSLSGVLFPGVPLVLLTLALVTLARRERAWLASFGAMALVAGVGVGLFGSDLAWRGSRDWLCLGGVALAGLWCVYLALASGPRETGEAGLLRTGAIAALSVGMLLLGFPGLSFLLEAAGAELPALSLHTLGRQSPLLLLALAGAGGPLLLARGRPWRALGALLLVASLTPAALGSQGFLTHFAKDPLVARVPAVELTRADPLILAERSFEHELWGFELSPRGRFFRHVHADRETFGTNDAQHVIADWEGVDLTVSALDLAFLDEAHMLAVRRAGDGLRLHSFAIAQPDTEEWRLLLPALEEPESVTLHAGGDHWQLVLDWNAGISTVLWGRVGEDSVERRAFHRPGEGAPQRHASTAKHALELSWEVEPHGTSLTWQRFAWLMRPDYGLTRLRFLGTGEPVSRRSSLQIECSDSGRPGTNDLLCLASTPRRSWVWAVDLDEAAFEPLSEITNELHWKWDGDRLARLTREDLLVLDPRSRRGHTIALPQAADWSTGLSMTRSAVGLSWPDETAGTTRVVLLSAE